ncbi:hypothetical protein J2S43_003079 [Catenuloplanes nepalensis]|uniref:DUF4184 family protein n=1 Tax=Catenuloplanes nepalensis TaxID=587533 RepID=A0ABT9MT08_9ACTN|nr:DUF4184 family protein [Catenuloplanes nepalensis]MDP9794567.1 hypothetical protein [Catenuloplanes nepalensis]
MPLTFPSHAALPLPLKLWRPRWFDGVALVVGSASPDLAYALDGTVLQAAGGVALYQVAHGPLGLPLFCLPVTLVCAVLVRRAAPVVAAHLPPWPAWLAPRDYGVLGAARPTLPVTVVSALLGAASHQVWDAITDHAPIADLASTVGGAIAALPLAVHIGRRRMLRAWHGEPPVVAVRPGRFWGVAALVAVAGAAIISRLPGAALVHTTGARLIGVFALSLLAATALHAAMTRAARLDRARDAG